MSMSLALFICVSFISLIQLANGAQFLIFFSLLFRFAAVPVFGTVIVALTSI